MCGTLRLVDSIPEETWEKKKKIGGKCYLLCSFRMLVVFYKELKCLKTKLIIYEILISKFYLNG